LPYKIDFALATSDQIEAALCRRVERIRLSRNVTQAQLAREAGISVRTIGRLEKGQGVSLDTFIRVLAALGIQDNLNLLLPDPAVRPMERVREHPGERKRARPTGAKPASSAWSWGNGRDDR